MAEHAHHGTTAGGLPQNVIVFGPDGNCTIEICPLQWSVLQYRPSIPASSVFIALFGVAILIHTFLGIRWRSWFFMSFMIVGSLLEIVGYIGRIILHNNPFSFIGFMIQIVFITVAPVFYTASIYVTLSKTINYLAPEISRIKPALFLWIFIPADVICLVLQAAGGALSTISSGSSQTGVDIALAGLGLQVAVLFIFSTLFVDYLVRYVRKRSMASLGPRIRIFLTFLFSSIILILARCAYRCYELSKGYVNSDLITDEGLFIGLESVLIVVAVFTLCIGHPGLVFGSNAGEQRVSRSSDSELTTENKP